MSREHCISYHNDGYSVVDDTQCIGCIYFNGCMFFYNRNKEYQDGFKRGMLDYDFHEPPVFNVDKAQYIYLRNFDKGYYDGWQRAKERENENPS